LLIEPSAEFPRLHGRLFRGRHRLLDHLIGGGKVTCEAMAGCDESVADVVEMFRRLVARKPERGIEHRRVEMQQIADRVAILAGVQPPEDSSTTGAFALL